MVRIIYRFSIVPGAGAEFRQCWEEVTGYIQRQSSGARGSVLLRGIDTNDEYLAVARWESRSLWMAGRAAVDSVVPPPLLATLKALLSKDTTYEVFDELMDFPGGNGNVP